MSDSNDIQPIILCGGTGTRLWPLSRKTFPKQYLTINSKNNESLLQQTQRRLSGLNNVKNPILICNEEHRFIVAEQMREINVKPNSIILEPFGKNTLPAIVISALISRDQGTNPNLLILSSDHEIKNKQKFHQAIEIGIQFSVKSKLITFGVLPSSPETGYGYIESKENIHNLKVDGYEIVNFKEKPDLKTAKKYVDDKHHAWNSGIFMFTAETIIAETKLFAPEIFEAPLPVT